MKNLWRIIQIGIFLVLSLLLYRLTVNHSQYLGFQDENAHMTAGWLMNQGYQLYKDLFLNHQPLIYIISSLVDQLFHPNTVFLLVKRHREIIFLYSILWQAFYTFSFGWVFLLFFPIFELTKYLFLGNQFLGESLAVYPIIFVTIETIKNIIYKKNITIATPIIIAISLGIAFFSLALLVPAVLIYSLLWFAILMKKNIKYSFVFLLTGLIFIISLFLVWNIPLFDYIRETIINNKLYQIESYNLTILGTVYKSLFLVFSAFSFSPTLIQIIVMLTLLAITLQLISLPKKKVLIFFPLFFLVLLTNTREFSGLHKDYMGIFHALPWFGALLSVPFILFDKNLSFKILTKRKSHDIKPLFIFRNKVVPIYLKSFYTTNTLFIIFLMFMVLIVHPSSPLKNKRDIMNDHDINYSKFVTYGNVINVLKDNDDRLIAFPFETLILWQSRVRPATKLIEYYSWSYLTKEGREDFIDVLQNNTAEFLYYEKDRGPNQFDVYIQKAIEKEYIQIYHINKLSYLYIKKSKLNDITASQWQQANYYLFSLPKKN